MTHITRTKPTLPKSAWGRGDKTPPNAPDYHEDLAFPPEEVKWTPPTSDIVELREKNKKLKELLKELFETADVAYCEDELLTEIEEVLK